MYCTLPSFQYNLLSVTQLCSTSNLKCLFLASCCYIQDLKNDTQVAKGELIGNLYVLKPTSCESTVTHSCNLSLELWHKNLGHASFSTLKHLDFLHSECTENNAKLLHSCYFCFRAKQHRLPFRHSSIQTNCCFELIHIDI